MSQSTTGGSGPLAFASLAPSVRTVYTIHHCRDQRLIDLYRDFPNATYVGIPDSRTFVPLDAPEQLAEEVRALTVSALAASERLGG